MKVGPYLFLSGKYFLFEWCEMDAMPVLPLKNALKLPVRPWNLILKLPFAMTFDSLRGALE